MLGKDEMRSKLCEVHLKGEQAPSSVVKCSGVEERDLLNQSTK